MRKTRPNDFWFEIGSGIDPATGKHQRRYTVACRKCKATAFYHASGVQNDALRKIFTRDGWDIGRARNRHLCPDCNKPKPAMIEAVVVTPSQVPLPFCARLNEAWNSSTEAEQIAFFNRMRGEMRSNNKVKDQEAELLAEREQMLGRIEELLNEKARLLEERRKLLFGAPAMIAKAPASASAPAPAPDPDPDPEPEFDEEALIGNDDSGGADWWQELMRKG